MNTITSAVLFAELAERMQAHCALPNETLIAGTRLVVKTIADTVEDGNRAEFRRFGSFKIKIYKGRLGRNPSNGKAIEVPARCRIAFKAGVSLYERVDTSVVKEGGLSNPNS